MNQEETIPSLAKRTVAEGVGSAMLLIAVVGSGIMAERLSGGNVAISLLANTVATGAALIALILTFNPISGAHLNPAVTLSFISQSELAVRDALAYIAAQFVGAIAGVATAVAVANSMFGLPIFFASQKIRSGAPLLLSEGVATFGLLAVIRGCSRFQPSAVSAAVAAYITGAYWFTSSTSFANPAVTLARAASNTFSGIRLLDVPGFIVAQITGALLATALFRWLAPKKKHGE